MVRDLTALTTDMSLQEAVRIFSMTRVTGLPVVNDKQQVIGFLSEADVIGAIMPRSRDMSGIFLSDFGEIARKMGQARELSVGDYMTERPVTVTEDINLSTVSETMLMERLKTLPVVRDEKLVGVINRTDVCSKLMEDREAI